MDLPDILPEQLNYAASAENDTELFDLLIKKIPDFFAFFIACVDDETWCQKHHEFVHKALAWLTYQFFQGQISSSTAGKITEAIRPHFSVLEAYIPRDLTLVIDERKRPINTMLIATGSPFFRELIRRECQEKNKKNLELQGLDGSLILPMIDYFENGQIPDLWKWHQKEIISFLRMSKTFDLPILIKECQEILIRYVDPENVIQTLLTAYHEGWVDLKKDCEAYFNNLDKSVRFISCGDQNLGLEFLSFIGDSLDIFAQLASYLTHVAAHKLLPKDRVFEEIMGKCPRLIGLDISGSDAVSDSLLLNMPSKVQELSLAGCGWLQQASLRKIIETAPQLTKINLAYDTQLTYISLGDLRNLKQLKSLDLSYCNQFGDQDMQLLAQAAIGLVELHLADCRNIREGGFITLIRTLPHLAILNARRTTISDSVLIELGARCPHLISLDVTHCPNISERGVSELLRLSNSLRRLVLNECGLPADILEKWEKKYPQVEIISN